MNGDTVTGRAEANGNTDGCTNGASSSDGAINRVNGETNNCDKISTVVDADTDMNAVIEAELSKLGLLNEREKRETKAERTARKVAEKRIKRDIHPQHEKQAPTDMKKRADGTWGPTGLYGGRVKETPLLRALRDAIKPTRLERIERVLQARCHSVQCLFENLSDPANGASCLRSMEGLGLLEAHAVESYEPFHVQGGITIHADKWMVVNKYSHCLDAVDALKKKGFTLIATCLDDDAVPIDEVDYSNMDKVCLMYGNEERGLSNQLRRSADIKMYIPMMGFSQSFNISVSCAMTLFHLREKGKIIPDIDDATITDLYQRWMLMSTKRAITIVQRKELAEAAPDYI